MKRAWLLLFVTARLAAAQTVPQFHSQSFALRPQKAEGGVLLQCYAPDAHAVYLAGDFNSWANNVDGRITNTAFAMSGPDANGVWRKTVKLDSGVYRFKFNIDGEAAGWFAPDSIDEIDGDKNAIFRVDASGNVIVRSAHNPKWEPQITKNGELFQCYAPDAFIVYLAGDFNDWGQNRDGLVFDPQFAMKGPDANGVWRAEIELKPGRHLYQFVIDGDRWISDPNADESGGEKHSVVVTK
jgi:1,4-alpha-glucan branching enzyme